MSKSDFSEVTGNLFKIEVNGEIYGLQLDFLTPRLEKGKAKVYISLCDKNGTILHEVSRPHGYVLKGYLNGTNIEKEMLDELADDAKLMTTIDIDLKELFKEIRKHRKKK